MEKFSDWLFAGVMVALLLGLVMLAGIGVALLIS
jgi:hypothetical protein